MSQIYRIKQPKNYDGFISAGHQRSLPGAQCPICGGWSNTGPSYPSISHASLDAICDLSRRYPAPLDDLRHLTTLIHPLAGPNRPLFPGTNFGPMFGRIYRAGKDFAWSDPWTILLSEDLLRHFHKEGVNLVSVKADLIGPSKSGKDLHEIEIPPKARLVERLRYTACDICGRGGMAESDEMILDTKTIDLSLPLQRIFDLTPRIIANESFIQALSNSPVSPEDYVIEPVKIE